VTAATANDAVTDLMRRATVCDMVFVYEPPVANDWRRFEEYRAAGVHFIQCHPAGDGHNISEAIQHIARFRRDVLARSGEALLVESVDDIARARAQGVLGVGLQLEGFRCLERNIDMIELYYKLGVRLCHPIHNVTNSLGGGCADGDDIGLTVFGRTVLCEMNRVGMIADGAHAGKRVQLDLLEHSADPVVFSHHGAATVHPHIRNVTDEVIDGCAARDGVIGMTGAGFYLGGFPTANLLFRHVDYVVQRVGARHVGIALDHFLDVEDQRNFMADRPHLFPGLEDGAWEPVAFAPPSILHPLVRLMLDAGYGDQAVFDILGGNWLRVCSAVWR
jgi:membrane dipeptidase